MASEREKSPRRGMAAATLTLEAFVLALSVPVMIVVADVPASAALPVGLGLAALCIVVAGMLRREWAYGLGWAIQVAAIGLGFLVGTMFFLGALFLLLWGSADLLGRRIEQERREAFARFDAEQAGGAGPT